MSTIGSRNTSGPGVVLKGETVGLAVATELPLLVIDVQRAGPSTGMPTKTEQTDLLMAMFGRPDNVFRAPGRVAAEEDAFARALHGLLVDDRHVPLVEVDSYIAFNPREGILLSNREDDIVGR